MAEGRSGFRRRLISSTQEARDRMLAWKDYRMQRIERRQAAGHWRVEVRAGLQMRLTSQRRRVGERRGRR